MTIMTILTIRQTDRQIERRRFIIRNSLFTYRIPKECEREFYIVFSTTQHKNLNLLSKQLPQQQ